MTLTRLFLSFKQEKALIGVPTENAISSDVFAASAPTDTVKVGRPNDFTH